MEKLICGRVILYRLACPYCGEVNLSGTHKFICSSCDSTYSEKQILATHRIAKLQKDVRISLALEKQNNHCFYCENEFGKFISRDNHIGKLIPVVDIHIPFDAQESLSVDDVILICNICHLFHGHKLQFQTMIEKKQWLKYMWSKDINLGKLNYY